MGELVPFLFVADSNFDPVRSCFLFPVHRVSRLVFVFTESLSSMFYPGVSGRCRSWHTVRSSCAYVSVPFVPGCTFFLINRPGAQVRHSAVPDQCRGIPCCFMCRAKKELVYPYKDFWSEVQGWFGGWELWTLVVISVVCILPSAPVLKVRVHPSVLLNFCSGPFCVVVSPRGCGCQTRGGSMCLCGLQCCYKGFWVEE